MDISTAEKTSVSNELRKDTVNLLQETVTTLQREMEMYKAKAKSATDQLTGLIELVKRSRAGDESAEERLSSFLGCNEKMPGTERSNEFSSEKMLTLWSRSKTRAVQNWLHLTTRLMAAECARLESLVQQEQYAHFAQRALYLDEMASRQTTQMTETLKVLDRHTTSDNGHLMKVKIRPHSGKLIKGRPTSQQRVKSAKAASEGHTVAVSDFFMQPSVVAGGASHAASNDGEPMPRERHVERKSNQGEELLSKTDDACRGSVYTTYDDPSRYVERSVYDCSMIVKKTVRPTSGSSAMKASDAKRSRPKSSLPASQGRPLKYETTRMVSVKPERHTAVKAELKKTKAANGDEGPTMKTVNKPLNGIQAYENDVNAMTAMEKKFKEATLTLQQRLGIVGDGTVI